MGNSVFPFGNRLSRYAQPFAKLFLRHARLLAQALELILKFHSRCLLFSLFWYSQSIAEPRSSVKQRLFPFMTTTVVIGFNKPFFIVVYLKTNFNAILIP